MTNERDLHEEESLEIVAVSAPEEAQMIEELLRNNNISCTLQGNVRSNPWPATSDLDEVRILVRQSDLPAAKELVSAYFKNVGTDEEE